MTGGRESSGIAGVDAALGGGLLTGDNVVWFGGDDELHAGLHAALFAAAPENGPKTFVTTHGTPARVAQVSGCDVEVLDARPSQRLADPIGLERAVLDRGAPGGRVVIDNLDDLVRRLGPERALALFSRICPQLFGRGAVCYWRAGDGSRVIRDRVRSVTQCVLDIAHDRLRIEKAEGRHGVQGRFYRLRFDDGELRVAEERAVGRLAEGLRSLRGQRQLSQSDVARIAGVSPSAISQVESGHRGLGLETVVAIAEGFGASLDDLLGAASMPGYVITRRDRALSRRGVTPLLDNPASGLRAYLVHLGPGERGEPPVMHKGPELIVVATGLVQVDLGPDTPVMRAGDAALATTLAVRGWKNLLSSPARFLWIPRDPLAPESPA